MVDLAPDPTAPAPDTSLFGEATRFSTLWTAWERIRANQGAAGGDGVTIRRFEGDAQNRISRLSHSLRSGRYRPGPVRRAFIPKRSGGVRPLDIPCVVDRVAQGGVALVLMRVLDREMEDSSFAYRPGRSVAEAVARVAALRRDGFCFVVDGDITRYFENVPHERLIRRLEQSIDDLRLVDLVGLWLEQHSHTERGLPQGSPISPVLANLFLDDVDEAIEGRGVRLVRFADDFVLLCKTEALAKGANAKIAALLGEHGLELNPDKTRIVPFDQGFRFLGHVFVRSMVWREVLREEIPSEDAVEAAERAIAALDRQDGNDEAHDDEAVASAPRGRWSTKQRVLYVLEPRRILTASNDCFVVRDDEIELLRLPHRRVDRIEVGAAAGIDHEALDLAAASDTEIVRVNGHGETLGTWRGVEDVRADRHLAQAATILDPARRVALASAIVKGRIASQRAYLRRLDRTRHDSELDVAAVRLGRILRRCEAPGLGVDELMGFEGEAGALYWPALARAVGPEWTFSGKRLRRTRDDPVNILLDVASSLLSRDIGIAAGRCGLHLGFAALHATTGDRPSLIFDLMEEFRAPIAEALVLALIGRKAVTPDMFAREKNAWRMTRDAWGPVIRGYEGWVARPIKEPRSGDRMLWRALFEVQAMAYARACENNTAYSPYVMDY